MKRYQRQLESDAAYNQRETGKENQGGLCCGGSNVREFHGSRFRIHERHAENQKGGGCAGKYQVLQPRFERFSSFSQVRNHDVERHAQNFQPKEERDEMAARCQHQRPENRKKEKNVKFLLLL